MEAWKSHDFNKVWSRDLAIVVRRSNQLNYEATDVGSWSFVSSNHPVKNGWSDIWNVSYIGLRISNQVSYDHRRGERNLSNCGGRPEKVRTSTRFEAVTSRYRCHALTNWTMKPMTLGAGHLWVLIIPWIMGEVIYEMFHILDCGFQIK